MDDAELVAAAVAGDRSAWGAIYDRYADRLHDHCWSILRDQHEAADALHDAFVAAAGSIGQLRDPSRLRPWLYAIARNEACRRHRARGRVVPTEDVPEMSTPIDDEPTGNRTEELRKLVWDAAGGLSVDDQALLDLHLRQGLEGEELANALGISTNNAYVRLSRLRDTLERSLGALLVARTGSHDCPELRTLVKDWDGVLSPLLRKRIAHHVDECEVCGERRRSLVSPLALLAGVPLLPAPAALRERILDDMVLASTSSGPSTHARPGSPRSASGLRWAIGGAAAAAVVVAALILALFTGGDGDEQIAADATSTTTEATTTTDPSTTTESSETTETSVDASVPSSVLPAPALLRLRTTVLDLGDTGTRTTLEFRNTGAEALTWAITTSNPALRPEVSSGSLGAGATARVPIVLDRNASAEGPLSHDITVDAGPAGRVVARLRAVVHRAPLVTNLFTDDASLQPPCGETTTTTAWATIDDESGFASAVLHWDGPENGQGQRAMSVGGTMASATLGPFSDVETVEWWVVATDNFGNVTESPHQSIVVNPCPG